jgi:hypothetical protein
MKNKITEKYRWKMFRVISEKVFVWWKEKDFEFAERAPWVRILLMSWDKILLTFEKRLETKDWVDYRLPWWKVFDEIDDYISFLESWKDINLMAKNSAKRELEEETWIILQEDDFKLFQKSHAGSSVKWDLYYYVAEVDWLDTSSKEINTEEWEDIKTWWYTKKGVMEMCLNWDIKEDRSLGIILKYLLSQNRK